MNNNNETLNNKSVTNVVELRLKTNLLSNKASLSTTSRRLSNVVASGLTATVLFGVTLVNYNLSQNESNASTPSRGIASIAPDHITDISQWDSSLLKKMAEKAERKMASFATKATALEQLRFGVLEGKYAIRLNEGKVTEINYQEMAQGSGDRPKYIESKDEFLNEFKDVVKPEFTAANLVSEKIENGNIVEVYRLVGSKSSPVAEAHFVSDQYGRLMSLKIQEL